jgi:prevent-host-death family protein
LCKICVQLDHGEKHRKLPFSQARQQLSAIIDKVQKSARPVTIVRHGKPVAVVISNDEFEFLQKRASRKKKWRLAGSLKLRKAVDIDKVLEKAKQDRIRIVEKRHRAFHKELNET